MAHKALTKHGKKYIFLTVKNIYFLKFFSFSVIGSGDRLDGEPVHRSTGPRFRRFPSLILLLFFPVLLPFRGDAQEASDSLLNGYLRTAAENNPGLIAKFREYQEALKKVPQQGTLPDPEVALGYFVSPPETRVGPQVATFSVSQMFPWKGTIPARKAVAAERAKARYHSFIGERANLWYRVKRVWYDYYETREKLSIAREQVDWLRSLKETATQRYETGEGSMVDVLRIQMELRKLETRLADISDALDPLRTHFEELLGDELEAEPAFPDSMRARELSMERDVLRDSILARDPKLSVLEHRLRAGEESERLARKKGRPSIGLGLNYTVVDERRDADLDMPDNGKDIFMPKVKLRIPIYRKKYDAMEEEARIRQERRALEKKDRKNELATVMDEAFEAYADAGRALRLYEAQLSDVKRARALLLESYSTGEADFEELIRIQRMVFDHRLRRIEAVLERNRVVARFEALMNASLSGYEGRE